MDWLSWFVLWAATLADEQRRSSFAINFSQPTLHFLLPGWWQMMTFCSGCTTWQNPTFTDEANVIYYKPMTFRHWRVMPQPNLASVCLTESWLCWCFTMKGDIASNAKWQGNQQRLLNDSKVYCHFFHNAPTFAYVHFSAVFRFCL